MVDILIKKDSIEKKANKDLVVSWSKLRQFGECPVSWFCINYADITNVQFVKINQTNAVGGTIIQKLFESFVNSRVYKREDMKTLEDIVQWFKMNSRAVFKLISRPLEDQLKKKYKNARKYFKNKTGQRDLDKAIKNYGLDPCITPPQITFIDWAMLDKDYATPNMTGEEGFLQYLDDIYSPILEMFVEHELNLDVMFSELFIKTKLNGIWLDGYIDFIYNKNQEAGEFNDLKQLSEGYILLDGKKKISKYVHKEQLFFYGTLLYLKHKRVPSCVGFIDWTKPRFAMYNFDQNYLDILKDKIQIIRDTYDRLRQFMIVYPNDLIPLSDFDLIYKSSSNCVFCPLVEVCKMGIERKEELDRLMQAIENKRETDRLLKGVDRSKIIQEIGL